MMDISLSNMYFFKPLDEVHLIQLKKAGVSAIELAPFHQLSSYNHSNKVKQFKSHLSKTGMSISGIQGFTFLPNKPYLKDAFMRNSSIWRDHFKKVLEMSSFLECKSLVFGAPNFRDNLLEKEMFDNTFIASVELSNSFGIDLFLEAVPKTYGCLIYNTFDKVVKFNSLNNLKTHFDTGCFINEKSKKYFNNFWPTINIDHFHLSSDDLSPCSSSHFLRNYLSDLNFKNIKSKYIVLESTTKSKNLSQAICDISFVNKILQKIPQI